MPQGSCAPPVRKLTLAFCVCVSFLKDFQVFTSSYNLWEGSLILYFTPWYWLFQSFRPDRRLHLLTFRTFDGISFTNFNILIHNESNSFRGKHLIPANTCESPFKSTTFFPLYIFPSFKWESFEVECSVNVCLCFSVGVRPLTRGGWQERNVAYYTLRLLLFFNLPLSFSVFSPLS